jgi:hypothetical protein
VFTEGLTEEHIAARTTTKDGCQASTNAAFIDVTSRCRNEGVETMSEEVKSGMVSRRTALSLFGVAAGRVASLADLGTLGLAVPTAVLTTSEEAEAQTAGMERRQERRGARRERRETRRTARRAGRETRRAVRRGTATPQ